MLDAVAELGEDGLRQVERVLRDEVDADALAADEADDLFDLFDEGLRGVVEEEVGFVEEEDELGFFHVADFGQFLEEFGEQPEQEGGVEAGRVDELVGGQDVDGAAAIGGEEHEVGEFQGRLAEEGFAALLVQHQQLALDGADAGLADVAVFGAEFAGAFGDVGEDGAEVLEVQQ